MKLRRIPRTCSMLELCELTSGSYSTLKNRLLTMSERDLMGLSVMDNDDKGSLPLYTVSGSKCILMNTNCKFDFFERRKLWKNLKFKRVNTYKGNREIVYVYMKNL